MASFGALRSALRPVERVRLITSVQKSLRLPRQSLISGGVSALGGRSVQLRAQSALAGTSLAGAASREGSALGRLRAIGALPRAYAAHVGSLHVTLPAASRRVVSVESLARSTAAGSIRRAYGSYVGSGAVQRLRELERSANASPADPGAQAAYLRALNDSGYHSEVTRRIALSNFAVDSAAMAESQRAREALSRGSAGAMGASGHASSAGGLQSSFAGGGGGVSAAPMGALGGGGGGNPDNPLHVVVQPKSSGAATAFNVLRMLSVLVLFAVVYSMMSGRGGVNPLENLTGNFSDEQQEIPDVGFDDVKGCAEAKQELENVVDFLKNPDKYTRLGGKIPKGVLLTGPPGTGKTLLARAVAGEAGVPFFSRSASEFEEMLVGLGASRVRKLFTAAREAAPCIIFIDEIDAIGGRRNKVSSSGYDRQTLNQLLASMDGFVKNESVIVMAATNFPEGLDAALTRPGRFDSTVPVPLPDVQGRRAILEHYLTKTELLEDIDVGALAKGTPGMSGADLETLVNHAALSAAARDAEGVTAHDIEDAKDKIMLGPARKTKVIKRETLLKTAYHEGGHTLVAMETKHAMPVHKTTILPRGQAAGVTYMLPTYQDEGFLTRAEILAQIDVAMGGRVAEEMIYGTDGVTTGAGSDMQTASRLARQLVKTFSMGRMGLATFDEQSGRPSPETQNLIDAEVKEILDDSYKRATELLTRKRKQLDKLAAALLEHETLSLEEMRVVVDGGSLPSKKMYQKQMSDGDAASDKPAKKSSGWFGLGALAGSSEATPKQPAAVVKKTTKPVAEAAKAAASTIASATVEPASTPAPDALDGTKDESKPKKSNKWV